MAPFNGQPSRSQQVFLALAPKFTGFLSLCGSAYIIQDVLLRTRQTKRHTYHRLMVGLSIADMIMTTGLFLSTWPMPADTPSVAFAVGNTQTCAVVGFMEHAGVAAVLYNASLSVYYWLRIRCGWTSRKIQKVAEPWLHAVPVVFGLSTMVAAASLKLFNAGLWDCWIYPHPHGCNESWRNRNQQNDDSVDDNPCIRGDNATLYQWLFDVIPKWGAILFVTAVMVAIHRAVWRQEQASRRFSMRGGAVRLARPLARQSYLYVGALYITYIPVIITRLTEIITGSVYYGMIVSIALLIPLQGFWNLLVFLRPRYLQSIKKQQQRRQSSSSGNLPFRFLRAVSEAVQQGALDEEVEGGDTYRDGGGEDEEEEEEHNKCHDALQNAPHTMEQHQLQNTDRVAESDGE